MKKSSLRTIALIWAAVMIAVVSSTLTLLFSGRAAQSQESREHWVSQEEYDALQNSVASAAARGYVDQIVEPADLRKHLIGAMEVLYSKREDRPLKKHGTV